MDNGRNSSVIHNEDEDILSEILKGYRFKLTLPTIRDNISFGFKSIELNDIERNLKKGENNAYHQPTSKTRRIKAVTKSTAPALLKG